MVTAATEIFNPAESLGPFWDWLSQLKPGQVVNIASVRKGQAFLTTIEVGAQSERKLSLYLGETTNLVGGVRFPVLVDRLSLAEKGFPDWVWDRAQTPAGWWAFDAASQPGGEYQLMERQLSWDRATSRYRLTGVKATGRLIPFQ